MKRVMLIVGVLVVICICASLAVTIISGGGGTTSPTRTPAPTQPSATPSGYITRAALGDAWPFTVDDGQLACNAQGHVTFASAGVVYALNGTAKSAIDNGASYRVIDEIWRDDPSNTGLKINLQLALDAGLALCK